MGDSNINLFTLQLENCSGQRTAEAGGWDAMSEVLGMRFGSEKRQDNMPPPRVEGGGDVG